MDDKQIVALLWGRSQEALMALAEKYGRRLQSLARNILGSEEDAAECVNDTYLALWNSIPPQKPDPLGAYACRVCKNAAISRLRKNRAAKRGELTVSLEELSECIGEDTLQHMTDSKALGEAIDRFLQKKLMGRQPDRAERKKLSDALMRRGYGWEDIRSAMGRLGIYPDE